jgi:hypothetical protein
MRWRIEQRADGEWAVHNRASNEVHFAQTPEDAVALLVALRKAEENA